MGAAALVAIGQIPAVGLQNAGLTPAIRKFTLDHSKRSGSGDLPGAIEAQRPQQGDVVAKIDPRLVVGCPVGFADQGCGVTSLAEVPDERWSVCGNGVRPITGQAQLKGSKPCEPASPGRDAVGAARVAPLRHPALPSQFLQVGEPQPGLPQPVAAPLIEANQQPAVRWLATHPELFIETP